MPYRNIVFAKLEKRLQNDPRWYMMSEPAQLNYIRLILFAAETYNKIPKNLEAIKKAFKTDQNLKTIEKTINEIRANFPKFKQTQRFYYFEGFEEKTNYIPKGEILGKSLGLPKEATDKDKEEEEDKEKDKKKTYSYRTFEEANNPKFKDYLKSIYPEVDIELEFKNMESWIRTNPKKGQKKNYARFVRNWINGEAKRMQELKSKSMFPEFKPEPVPEPQDNGLPKKKPILTKEEEGQIHKERIALQKKIRDKGER